MSCALYLTHLNALNRIIKKPKLGIRERAEGEGELRDKINLSQKLSTQFPRPISQHKHAKHHNRLALI